MSLLHASILTIFPEMFPGPLQYSLAGQALRKKIWTYDIINIRNFGLTKHHKVDDEPYGGGNGLIMRPDVVGNCIEHVLSSNIVNSGELGAQSDRAKPICNRRVTSNDVTNLSSIDYKSISTKKNVPIYYLSPRGKLFSQTMAHEIIKQKQIIILCGRFKGIDERVIDEYNVEEISIGDYILSGGEIAALALLDCLIRLLPNVLVNKATLQSESFEKTGEFNGLLECPLYTRPVEWKEKKVPDILLSGNHQLIREWKKKQSIEITKKRRPELLSVTRSGS